MIIARPRFVVPLVAALLAAGGASSEARQKAKPATAPPSFWNTPPPRTAGDPWTKDRAATQRSAPRPAAAPAAPPAWATPPPAASQRAAAPAPRVRATAPRATPTPSAVASAGGPSGAAGPSARPVTTATAPAERNATTPETRSAAIPTVNADEGVVVPAPVVAAAPEPQLIVTPRDPVTNAAPAARAPANPFPSWMTVGLQYRGRVEATRSIAARGADYDTYYLNRLRVRTLFAISRSFEFFGEGQDSRVAQYDGVGVPRTMRNVFDLRQAYVDLHARDGKSWRVRVGRQEMALGDGRLIASSDWGNVNRTYEIVRASGARGRARLDVFGGYIVQLEPDALDRRKKGEYLYGAWGHVDNVAPQTAVEPFVVVRRNDDVVGEDAVKGHATLVTVGARATSRLWKRVDVAGDLVVQRGTCANDDISAWAFHQLVAVPFPKGPWKPRVAVEFATASGDDNPKDGRKQTFDQLYASNHSRYGLADQVGWRNMRDLAVTLEATPLKPVKVGLGAHRLFLATVNDGLYGSSGSRVVLNRTAASGDIGLELDGWIQWTVSKELSVAAGLGSLHPGAYLKASTDGRTLWAPYLVWNVKF